MGNVSNPRHGQVGASLGPDEEIALLDVTEEQPASQPVESNAGLINLDSVGSGGTSPLLGQAWHVSRENKSNHPPVWMFGFKKRAT